MEKRTKEPAALAASVSGALLDFPGSSENSRISALIELEQLSRWVEAARHRMHVAIAGESPVDFVSSGGVARVRDVLVDEIAVAMGWSAEWAKRQVALSRILVTKLPRLMAELESGRMSTYQAWAAAEGYTELEAAANLANRDPLDADAIVDQYCEKLRGQIDSAQGGFFRRAARKAVAELAPQAADDRYRRAADNRNVKVEQAQDGMAVVTAYLTALDAHRAWTAITAAAESCPALHGTKAQNIADALVGLLTGSLGDGGWTPPATEVQIVVPMEVIQGQSSAPASIVGSEGLVLPSAVLELIGDARIRRIVSDPLSGQVLDYGRTTYRPPTNLRDHVVARDQVCRFPGCKKQASALELDHVEPWEDGGPTSVDNLVALCRRHHNLKTHLGWTYILHTDGRITWQSPGGYEWTDPSQPLAG